MNELEKLKKQYAAKIESAKTEMAAFGEKPIPKEDQERITALFGAADEIKAQIELVERRDAAEAYLDEPAGTKAAHLGFRPSGPDEGDADVDVKAWRSFEVKVPGKYGVETKTVRYHVPLAVQKKGYDASLEAYMRWGKDKLGPNDRKALAEAADASGGYLVSEDMQTNILKKIATMATVRQFARVVTTSSNMIAWPRINYSTDNLYSSGVRLTWTGETPSSATAHRVTDQVFGEFNIPVHTAMASQLLSVDLLMDSAFNVQSIAEESFAEAFALGENSAFWSGSGAGQPRGILVDAGDTTNFDAQVTVAATADAIEADDLVDTFYALPTQYERNARWFWKKATEQIIFKIKDADSDYIWQPAMSRGLAPGAPGELMGSPFVRDELVDGISDSDNTTTYPVVYGDLMAYAIVDRVGLSVQRLDELYAETNQALLLGKKRVGGQLVESYRLSLLRTVNST